ncbi:MAG: uracil phosphoribosyltransferase [Flavobacteriia bacterium]|nr:uracil phosphoribosyltransferase [Flavobacteriia bacterium]
MKKIFEALASLFEDLLFLPYSLLTDLELYSWWLANGVTFMFIAIGFVAAVYWIKQLQKFDKNGEENKDPSAHSFL